jgi:hypothetical protein
MKADKPLIWGVQRACGALNAELTKYIAAAGA